MRNSLAGISISFALFALGAQAQTPTFTATSVFNAASMVAGPIAPGMVAIIQGSNLGDPQFPGSCMNVSPVPATCTAVSVLVNGAAAPKIYDSASEVTFQVPFSVGGSNATIQVTSSLSGAVLSSAVVNVPVAAAAPGLYTYNANGYYYDSSAGLFGSPGGIVNAGDTVVLYGTGFGVTTPAVATGALAPAAGAAANANVTMTINNQAVKVTFAGLGGTMVGWDQVIFTVPSTLTVPVGKQTATFSLVVTVGGVASQAVNLIVSALPITLTAISPSPVPLYAGLQTVTFTGSGFEPGLTLTLESANNQQIPVPSANMTLLSSTQIVAQINVGTTPGTWSAIVENTDGLTSNIFSFTPKTVTPTITGVVTTSSNAPQISQNAWIEVHGTYLSVSAPITWANASFANGLPTSLTGVSATVDNKPAAVFYASPTQINILAPLDSATGSVPVQLNTPLGETSTFTVTEVQAAPAFLVIDLAGHVAAEHVPSLTYLGPPALDAPGYTFTPAVPGETVAIYTTGFGQTSPAFTNQLTNTGLPGNDPFPINLPSLPAVTIGNLPATVSFGGLVGAGLYQINLVIPPSAPAGDLPIVAMYNGVSTQANAVITVQ